MWAHAREHCASLLPEPSCAPTSCAPSAPTSSAVCATELSLPQYTMLPTLRSTCSTEKGGHSTVGCRAFTSGAHRRSSSQGDQAAQSHQACRQVRAAGDRAGALRSHAKPFCFDLPPALAPLALCIALASTGSLSAATNTMEDSAGGAQVVTGTCVQQLREASTLRRKPTPARLQAGVCAGSPAPVLKVPPTAVIYYVLHGVVCKWAGNRRMSSSVRIQKALTFKGRTLPQLWVACCDSSYHPCAHLPARRRGARSRWCSGCTPAPGRAGSTGERGSCSTTLELCVQPRTERMHMAFGPCSCPFLGSRHVSTHPRVVVPPS